ncbi:UDP-glucose/GDP-mannose dehydrogenase family protein [Pseudoalteromonas sp. CnMc7-15]|uniref:UDP-glucose dehydrogenase family protein n=1 Tax=unclassified Pseudoalteromonas TaxID=194690 RepID=UPI001EF5FFE7|nr:UDP-glucose/GDP-mannose dehydrogenase family protein [Pseudoalteromonas sp. CnMc7-15]MCG7567228.1 UDP-glucose/GDP-mannose dehydrogenase family protein [Pseudoalteromonas sp. CnMc7-15]
MKVTIFGSGYVGLVQAAVFAQAGHQVCCVDVNQQRIAQLQRNQIPIFEPGLTELVSVNQAQQRLSFTSCAEQGVNFADILFIAVGTPSKEDGSADLSAVFAVADAIGSLMQNDKVVVNKSTVPVGTADKVAARIYSCLESRMQSHLTADVASNPEFLKEGAAVADCRSPDRIIIGAQSEQTLACLRELYAPFCRQRDKILTMDRRSAELTKYAANCMLATKISFINEVANMAEHLGADIERVRQGIGADPRIGYHFIYPGIGYGGSCFPKDIDAMLAMAEEYQLDNCLLTAVKGVNTRQKHSLVTKVMHHFGDDVSGKTFAVWGLAFKPNTDDIREAPSLVTINELLAKGASVQGYDPQAAATIAEVYGSRGDVHICSTKEQALEGADALIICTEWEAFRAPDFTELHARLKSPLIFDGRNLYEPQQMQRHGFNYYCIGREAI